MKDKKILKIDSAFNFDVVFKRNHCTLLNIFTCEIKINYPYKVDGLDKNLTHPDGKLFSIQYREWMHERQFELEEGNFFSTKELASDYLKDNLGKLGLAQIDRAEAITLAKECLRSQKETRELLNKN